ncbi:PRC-barrel domain-containing protein [Streptomyces sp. CS081A]|uniref:PRC-barrel domain-containing protein n=1 Tax=Streptomyces sp. CS081A TaxID=2162709 RepID=UPI000D5229A4|nr:PRC-barrel domain-containing protein [Streptomyces sp. CS081A]PVC76480.1 PRC domain containing protein [Streptomyces sp. CS081A]
MTEHTWSYRSTAGHLAGTDLTGYKVEATDGGIGKVDKHSDEVDDSYLVVDTGAWIFGKEVLLPASTVTRIDPEERTIFVDRTKDQIKDAPEFHRDTHLDDKVYREQLVTYYGLGGPFGGRLV